MCGSLAGLKCSGCGLKIYCSKDHQKVDWKKMHKNECKCYEVNSRFLIKVGDFREIYF